MLVGKIKCCYSGFESGLFLLTSVFACLCCVCVPVTSYGRVLPPTLRCSSDSRDVNACLHKYMETDFMQLSRIIYRLKDDQMSADCNSSSHPGQPRGRSDDSPFRRFEEGASPESVQNCQRLNGIHDCLEQELDKCDELYAFFNLRHVVYSMKQIIHWLCGKPNVAGFATSDDNTHDEINSRFLVLLQSAQCLECFRTSNHSKVSTCYQRNRITQEDPLIKDSHLWLKILRLQVGPEVCSQLKVQFKCFQQQDVQSACGIKNNVYTNLTELFMETWCDKHPFLPPQNSSSNSHYQIHSLSTTRSLALVFLVILYFAKV